MSHRAVVAFETAPETYSLYYSRNGAENLQLLDVLEQWDQESFAPLQVDSDSHSQMPFEREVTDLYDNSQNTRDISLHTQRPAIDADPFLRGIPRQDMWVYIDFSLAEALYVVGDEGVETYYPLWLEPNVIMPWRDNILVEVYDLDNFPDSLDKWGTHIGATSPDIIIGEEHFQGPYLDDLASVEILATKHEWVYAAYRMGEYWKSEEQMTRRSLITEDRIYFIHSTSGNPLHQSGHLGMFVEVDDADEWLDFTHEAGFLRLPIGCELAEMGSPTLGDRSQGISDLVSEAIEKYEPRIAPFSHPLVPEHD